LRVARSIRLCEDARGLWHLRPALMQAVAAERGEGEARHAVATLDPLFRQAWPEVPMSREAVLG
jgi:hypothetical protein